MASGRQYAILQSTNETSADVVDADVGRCLPGQSETQREAGMRRIRSGEERRGRWRGTTITHACRAIGSGNAGDIYF